MPLKPKTDLQDLKSRGLAPAPQLDRKATDPFYLSMRWRRLRSYVLRLHPLCSDPFGYHAQDHVTIAAQEIDHMLPRKQRPDLSYDPANLQALCASCHTRKTRREETEVASGHDRPTLANVGHQEASQGRGEEPRGGGGVKSPPPGDLIPFAKKGARDHEMGEI